jgi:outer membrane protein assembly factor BamB
MHTTKPAIVGDAIYVGDGLGRLHRYDMADGGSVWSVDLDAPITGDPVVTVELIILGTSDGRLVALAQ